MPSTRKRQRLKLEKRQRQKQRRREAYIAASLPSYLRLLSEHPKLLAEQAALMDRLKKESIRKDSNDSSITSST